jgi:hypothetical protein
MGSKQRRWTSVSRRIYGVGSDAGYGWWYCCNLVSQPNAMAPFGIKLMHRRIYTVHDAPRYPKGHKVNLCGQIGVCLLACFGIAYCKWENKQRDLGKRDHRLINPTPAKIKNLGNRHPEFRFMY